MHEYDIIKTMAERFPRSPKQRNELFTCDAELIEIGGRLWGLTIDEFTPEEDLFSSEDPERLGANLATATLSDLLAAGVEPAFFMHAVCLPKQSGRAFVDGLSRGIASVLEAAGCFLCGGDLGTADTWRFCGFAMGPVADGKPLTRQIPAKSQILWVTGELGDANLAAFQGMPTPRFELRLEEAKFARRFGTAAIDTSGGFLDAVWLLHTINPELRFEIDVERLPLTRAMSKTTDLAGIPPEAALLGGAGEYELLFTTPATLAPSARSELEHAGLTPIGVCDVAREPGIVIRRGGHIVNTMSEPLPCPREAATVDEYVQNVIRAARKLLGG